MSADPWEEGGLHVGGALTPRPGVSEWTAGLALPAQWCMEVKSMGTMQSSPDAAGSAGATALSADLKPVFLLYQRSLCSVALIVPVEAFGLF